MLAKVSFAFGSPEVRILQTLRAQGTIRNLTNVMASDERHGLTLTKTSTKQTQQNRVLTSS